LPAANEPNDRIGQLLRFPGVLIGLLRALSTGECVVYLTIAQSLPGFLRDCLIIRLSSLFGHPVICHLHGGNYDNFVRSQQFSVQRLIHRTLEKVSAIVVLSERLRQMFEAAPALAERVIVIPNGLPPGIKVRKEGKLLPKSETERFEVLYLSNMVETKGYWDVLEAARLLKEQGDSRFHFRFCGDFMVSSDDSVKRTAQEAERVFRACVIDQGLTEMVSFDGAVSGEKKLEALESAHIFLLPTYYVNEGQPISMIEALAHATVIIATEYRAIPDMVIPGVNGFWVPCNEPAAIAVALRDAVADRTLYSRMSVQSLRLFNERFRGETHTANLISLFQHFAN